MKRGIHKKTKRGKSRQLSFCKRKALTYPKIEELLSTIPPEKYIEKPKTLRILYNSQDPIIIKKRWIRKYKRINVFAFFYDNFGIIFFIMPMNECP